MPDALAKAVLVFAAAVLGSTSRGDLVAHWPLDHDANDAAGNHHGIPTGAVVFGAEGAAAHTGTAAEFDGSSATITVPYSPDLNPASFTVTLWANADSTAGFASALTSRDDDGSSVNGYLLYNDSAGRWNFWTGGGGPPGSWPQLPGPAVEIGSWTHLAISYDAASQTMRLHVNGDLEQSATGPGLYRPNGPQSEDLHLGSGADDGSQFFFDGLLDDVAIWNEALGTAEIREVMTNGVPAGAPAIISFTADRSTIAAGQSVTLTWEVVRANTITITPDHGDVETPAGSVVVTPRETTTYTLTAIGDSPPHATAQLTVGVNVEVLPPVLSEFLADNQTGLRDSDGDREDWIEIHNPNAFAIDLGGWSLTDNLARLDKWTFPPHLVEAGEYLVLFASEKGGPLDLNFRLAAAGEYLALVSPDGEITQEFAPAFPPQFADVSFGIPSDRGAPDRLAPTPGEANGAALVEISPDVLEVTAEPASPAEDEDLTVTAEVESRLGAVDAVILNYRVGFEAVERIPMAKGDATTYTATIPSTAYKAGEMVRWFVTARTPGGESTRAPPFPDPTESAEYFGTVVTDPGISTSLPVLHWFVQADAAANTRGGAQASLFFKGRFYDNVFCRIRGQSTANWPKHKFKFDFYRGGHFFWKEGAPKVEEFNLNSHYRDGYVRENGIFAFLNEAGSPAPETMYLWVRRNGEDYGLFSFVEQIDEEFLGRHGFDASGPMYKAINVPATLSTNVNTSLYRKVLQRDEPYTDLIDFTANINSPRRRFAYVADEVNLPNYINVMAAMAVPFNHDQLTKNYYLYRDPHRDEWFRFPWDADQGFPTGQKNTHENWASPLYGDARHTQELLGGNPNPVWQNHMHAAILDNPITREMYLRRLRTLADRYLAIPPGQPNGYFEDLIRGFRSEITREALLDFHLWSATGIGTLSTGVRNVLDTSLPQRRIALFETYGPPGSGLVPAPEPADPVIEFGSIEFNPSSGDQDHEFIEIVNPNGFAVDLSGWRIEGGVSFTFPPGAVIPAAGADPERGKVFLSPDVAGFRTRPTSPTRGESRLVLGNYSGHLSNFGETLTLFDEKNRQVAQTVLPTAPSDLQLYLAISELMYHPLGDGLAEFIELVNTSDSVTLDLTGVLFSSGIQFDFTQSAVSTLAPGARVLVVRDRDSFQAVYGDGLPVAGVFAGGSALSNGGERIKLDDLSGSTVADFTYHDLAPWPEAADGVGYSLILMRPETGPDPDNPANWRHSTHPGGSPGGSDRLAYEGGGLLAYAVTGTPAIHPEQDHITFSYSRRLGTDDVEVRPEWSPDLTVWESEPLTILSRSPDGAGLETVTWLLPPERKGFVRLRVTERP